MTAVPDSALSPKKPRRRWLPPLRFSLRTLVILMLLIGSAGTWWLHRESWFPMCNLAEQTAPIEQVGFSPDGNIAFAVTHIVNPARINGHWDSGLDLVAVFNPKNGQLIHLLSGGSGNGNVWFSPLGSYLQLRSFHRNLRYVECAWNIRTGQMIEALGKQSPELFVLSFSPDERFAIVNVDEHDPVVVSMPGGELVAEFPGLSKAVFSNHSDRLVIPSKGGILIYDTRTWKQIRIIAIEKTFTCDNLQFSPDDHWLAVSQRNDDSNSEETIIYEIANGDMLFKFPGSFYASPGFSPDGKLLSTYSWNAHTYTNAIYSTNSGRQIVNDAGDSIVFSADSQRICSESGVWNAATGDVIWKPSGITYRIGRIYSADGKYVISNGDDVGLVSTTTGESLFKFPTSPWPNAMHVAFSPDSTQIVTAPIGRLRIKMPPHDPSMQATIWQRRRPEYWWGVAWLPEFWLTALFAGALVWSVWRDWKRIV